MKYLIALLIFLLSCVPPQAGITFVGAGTRATSRNANVTPTIPVTIANDLILVFAAVWGDSGEVAGTLALSGYTPIFNEANTTGNNAWSLFCKIAAGSDGNPTVTYTGGDSDDRVIAQAAVWRGTGTDCNTVVVEQGTLRQGNLEFHIGPISGITIAANNMVIVLGERNSSAWTSVATLSNDGLTWAEIGEPEGDYINIVWDYAIDGGSGTTVTDKTFTVTGGTKHYTLGKMIEIAVARPTRLREDPEIQNSSRSYLTAKVWEEHERKKDSNVPPAKAQRR
jgi:hypothetical protein